jgi:hypothetical protein
MLLAAVTASQPPAMASSVPSVSSAMWPSEPDPAPVRGSVDTAATSAVRVAVGVTTTAATWAVNVGTGVFVGVVMTWGIPVAVLVGVLGTEVLVGVLVGGCVPVGVLVGVLGTDVFVGVFVIVGVLVGD